MKIYINKLVNVGQVVGSEWYEAEIEGWEGYYEHLECSCFDVVMCEYKGHTLSVYCDDEGMLKSENLGRTVGSYTEPIFGNICVTGGVDDEGETLPIPEELSLDDMVEFIGDRLWLTK